MVIAMDERALPRNLLAVLPSSLCTALTEAAPGSVPLYVFKVERFRTSEPVKNGVFWDVTPCCSRKSRRFGGT
jgi:hypothetical protein